jgi:8-oxo-dGTP pyrophosphatase MutT (NUDIX family)
MNAAGFSVALQRVLNDASFLQERQRQRAALAPSLAYGRHFGPILPGARSAAVMALIEIDALQAWQDWTIPLIVRPNHMAHHPGQISLPGGSLNQGETPQAAAEREFVEELGLAPEAFPGEVLGALQSIYVYNSHFHIMPFVAASPPLMGIVPCRNEVERLIHLPLRLLASAVDTIERAEFARGSIAWKAPVIRVGEDQIWGATAIMLGELAAVIMRATAAYDFSYSCVRRR